MNTHDFTPPRSVQKQSRARSQRTYMLVLGMHRSGTSALTRTLSLGGADLPERLMAPSSSNETGYWESKALVAFNDRLLADLGSTWRDWGRLDLAIAGPGFRQAAKRGIQDILAADYGDARLAVVKDPRVCRFASLMIETLEEQGIRPAPIMLFRNPLEVMASLQLRDRMSPADAAMLWLRHVLDADAATRQLPRVIMSYDTLLADWRGALKRIDTAFDLALPHDVAAIAPAVAEFLSTEQRHHVSSTHDVLHNPLLRGWIADTYTALKILETTPDSPSALATLDNVRRNVEDATPVLLALTDAVKTESRQTIKEHDRQFASFRADLERQSAEAAARAEAEERRANDAGAKLCAITKELETIRQELSSSEQRATETRARADTAERRAEHVRTKLGATTLELEAIRKELAGAEQRAAEAAARADAADLEAEKLRDLLEMTSGELATSRETAAAAERQTELLSERLSENGKLVAGFREHVQILLSTLKEQQAAHATLERTLEDLAAKHAADTEDIARLTREVLQHKADAAKAKAEAAAVHKAKEATDKAKADTAAELQKARAATNLADAEKRRLENRLNERFNEIATLTRLLREKEAPHRPTRSRFRRAAGIFFNPRRWPQLWHRIRVIRETAALRRSGLFDAEWYLKTYPDVAAVGANPLRHYVQFGAAEGRQPSASAAPGARPRRTDCIH